MNRDSNTGAEQLRRAKAEARMAHGRLNSTMTALQQKLQPGALVGEVWDGVREKGGEIAEDAIQTVKDRPGTVTGIFAAFMIFLAREPLWDAVSGLFRREEEHDDLLIADIRTEDDSYDLAAPAISRSLNEGVSA